MMIAHAGLRQSEEHLSSKDDTKVIDEQVALV